MERQSMTFWKKDTDIYADILKAEKYIRSGLQTRQIEIAAAVEELLEAGGKRLRPALVLLSGKFGEYNREKLMPLAAAIEILHMATLVHDDIIDDAAFRRGAPTVQARWGRHIAVFTGDFLFTRAFSMITQTADCENMHKLSNVIKAICEGEIDQYQGRFKLETSVATYLKRIGKKTALLFGLSCRIGARQSKCPHKTEWNLGHFGYNLGMAFQIIDDILDFSGDYSRLGKPLLNDFINGVFTLPVIYTARQKKYKQKLEDIIRQGNFTKDELLDVRKWVENSGGLDYARQLAKRYMDKAIINLENLPPIPIRDELGKLIEELEIREC